MRRQARIGIIGVGSMGADHARNLFRNVPAARITAISDFDSDRAQAIANEIGADRLHVDATDLIHDPNVDGVLIASPDNTHSKLVAGCLRAGKRVLCEKPLAPTSEECRDLLAIEMAAGKRLVNVGFMRRFDTGYSYLQAAVNSRELGEPLMIHCVHRNPATVPGWTSEMQITNAAIHEIDIVRWLTKSEVASVQAVRSRARTGANVADPLFLLLKMTSELLVTVALFTQSQNGYEVSTEIVLDNGAVSAAAPPLVTTRTNARQVSDLNPTYRERFADAYRSELQEWATSIAENRPNFSLASAWDGYAATVVACSCIKSMERGEIVQVKIEDRPVFYEQRPGF